MPSRRKTPFPCAMCGQCLPFGLGQSEFCWLGFSGTSWELCTFIHQLRTTNSLLEPEGWFTPLLWQVKSSSCHFRQLHPSLIMLLDLSIHRGGLFRAAVFCSVLRRKMHTYFSLWSRLGMSSWKIRLCMSGALYLGSVLSPVGEVSPFCAAGKCCLAEGVNSVPGNLRAHLVFPPLHF